MATFSSTITPAPDLTAPSTTQAASTTAVNTAVASEATARTNADTAEATTRATNDSNEVTARTNADALLQTAVNGKQATLGYTAENTTAKGAASGYAPLDATGKVPAANLPAATAAPRSLIFEYPLGTGLTVTGMATATEAGSFGTATQKNVATATFYLNNTASALPLTVNDGDTVRVAVTLTSSVLGAYVILTA